MLSSKAGEGKLEVVSFACPMQLCVALTSFQYHAQVDLREGSVSVILLAGGVGKRMGVCYVSACSKDSTTL